MRKKWEFNVYDDRFVKIGSIRAADWAEAEQLAVREYTNAKHLIRVRP